jgi:hypothetical protein
VLIDLKAMSLPALWFSGSRVPRLFRKIFNPELSRGIN